MYRNSAHAYGLVARSLHWTTAGVIGVAIPLGLWAALIGPGAADPEQANLRETVLFWHKSMGLTVLLLSVGRIGWRFAGPRPPLPPGLSLLERIGARAAHLALYGLIFAMPLSGILISQAVGKPVTFFGLWSFPALISPDLSLPPSQRPELVVGIFLHKGLFWWSLVAILALHVGAVVKHAVHDRDLTVWRRMAGRATSVNEVAQASPLLPGAALAEGWNDAPLTKAPHAMADLTPHQDPVTPDVGDGPSQDMQTLSPPISSKTHAGRRKTVKQGSPWQTP